MKYTIPSIKENALKERIHTMRQQVVQWYILHQEGQPAPLTIGILKNLYEELGYMLLYMDPTHYKPPYPRFLLDSCQYEDDITRALLDLAHDYDRLRRTKAHPSA